MNEGGAVAEAHLSDGDERDSASMAARRTKVTDECGDESTAVSGTTRRTERGGGERDSVNAEARRTRATNEGGGESADVSGTSRRTSAAVVSVTA